MKGPRGEKAAAERAAGTSTFAAYDLAHYGVAEAEVLERTERYRRRFAEFLSE